MVGCGVPALVDGFDWTAREGKLMAMFIVGHGVWEAGDEGVPDWTFVPTSGEVIFFSDSGQNLAMTNGLAALEANSRANGYRYGGGEDIENYRLTPLADNERQLYETIQANSDTLAGAVYVGSPGLEDGIRLCLSAACRDAGVHRCAGVLAKFPGPIVVLACRGDRPDSTTQAGFGTTGGDVLNERYQEDYQMLAGMTPFAAGQWLYGLASYNPAAAPEDQLEAAYLLTSVYLSTALADFNTFRQYFAEIQAGDTTNIAEYVRLYDALAPADRYTVEVDWDVTNRVNAAVEAWKTPAEELSDEDLLRQLREGNL
jgi:hypothetical protein